MQMIYDLGYRYMRIDKSTSFLHPQYDILCFPKETVPNDIDGMSYSDVLKNWRQNTSK